MSDPLGLSLQEVVLMAYCRCMCSYFSGDLIRNVDISSSQWAHEIGFPSSFSAKQSMEAVAVEHGTQHGNDVRRFW